MDNFFRGPLQTRGRMGVFMTLYLLFVLIPEELYIPKICAVCSFLQNLNGLIHQCRNRPVEKAWCRVLIPMDPSITIKYSICTFSDICRWWSISAVNGQQKWLIEDMDMAVPRPLFSLSDQFTEVLSKFHRSMMSPAFSCNSFVTVSYPLQLTSRGDTEPLLVGTGIHIRCWSI